MNFTLMGVGRGNVTDVLRYNELPVQQTDERDNDELYDEAEEETQQHAAVVINARVGKRRAKEATDNC